jgi:redox-sensitive bicupin YhaK (pirin superfamily)
VGVDLELVAGRTELALQAEFEHAVVVLDGSLSVDDVEVKPGELAYLGTGRASVTLDTAADARALLLGGQPFESELLMWWNFVARTKSEVESAYDDWRGRAERFPDLPQSPLGRIPAPRPSWLRT